MGVCKGAGGVGRGGCGGAHRVAALDGRRRGAREAGHAEEVDDGAAARGVDAEHGAEQRRPLRGVLLRQRREHAALDLVLESVKAKGLERHALRRQLVEAAAERPAGYNLCVSPGCLGVFACRLVVLERRSNRLEQLLGSRACAWTG